jgi:adenylate cyclase
MSAPDSEGSAAPANGDSTAAPPGIPPETEAIWRGILMGTDPRYREGYSIMKRLPGSPRCRLCSAPFKGAGAVVARRMGRRPWAKNPHYCSECFTLLEHQHGGAEIDCSLLFADVRGSTALAERMGPSAFRGLLDRFYDTAAGVLFEHEAILDKFVGDEVFAIFVPAFTGAEHGGRAVAAALELLRGTGHGQPGGPWLPIGIGVHSGVAYVGAVGEFPSTTVTALGDPVNVASRLASAAGAGELLVSAVTARASGVDDPALEHRELELRGKSERVPVVVLGAGAAVAQTL